MRRIVYLIVLVFGSAQALEVPYLSGRIVDEANIIDASTEQNLTQALKSLEDQTSDQIAVLTVPSLEGDSLEDFTTRVFQKWQLGQKGKDNGILFLVVPNDRKMRIEVGYGLEEKIPDAKASQIIRNLATPAFKQQNYSGGISAVVLDLVNRLQAAPGQYVETQPAETGKKPSFPWFFIIFFIIAILSSFGRRRRSFLGGLLLGGMSSGGGSSWGGGGGGGFSGGGGSSGGGGASGSW